MLAEMGVAIGVDGHTVGLFQPRRVGKLWTQFLRYDPVFINAAQSHGLENLLL